ncbi:MAG: lipase family protein [Phycisphaerales bacterium]|nr:lipase family protein [Phycisphaerales bacterium]
MDALSMLDLLIGLVTVFAVFSLVCTALVEVFAQFFHWRQNLLRKTIDTLLGHKPPPIQNKLYELDSIKALSRGSSGPSYIEKTTFSKAIADLVLEPSPPDPTTTYQERAEKLGPAGKLFATEYARNGNNLPAARAALESWYQQAMDRLTGTYKRRVMYVTIGIATVLVFTANVDTIAITRRLSSSPEARARLVEHAQKLVAAAPATTPTPPPKPANPQQPTSPSTQPTTTTAQPTTPQPTNAELQQLIDNAKDNLYAVEGIVGWTDTEFQSTIKIWYWKIPGFLISIIALTLGGPFWFDILQKLVNIRTSLKPAASSTATSPTDTPPTTDGTTPNSPASPNPSDPSSPSTNAYTRGLVGFAPRSTRENTAAARWLAELANLTYEPSESAIKKRADELNLTGEVIDLGALRAVIFSDSDCVIIAFRGTDNASNWIDTNAQFKLAALKLPADTPPFPGRVHAGFNDAASKLFAALAPHLTPEQLKGRAVWLTGHSLGGALAVLSAAAITRTLPHVNIYGIYTFGQPRVGDADFCAAYDALLKDRTFRTVNNRDMVPRAPTRIQHFREVGSVRYFDARGQLFRDPGMWFQILDTIIFDKQIAIKQAQELAGDHSMKRYVELWSSAGASS